MIRSKGAMVVIRTQEGFIHGVAAKGEYAAGMRRFPMGKAKIGERPIKNAIREFKEETGAMPTGLKLVGKVKWTVQNYREMGPAEFFIHVFLGNGINGELGTGTGELLDLKFTKEIPKDMLQFHAEILRRIELNQKFKGQFVDDKRFNLKSYKIAVKHQERPR